jgi:hypothetical protein
VTGQTWLWGRTESSTALQKGSADLMGIGRGVGWTMELLEWTKVKLATRKFNWMGAQAQISLLRHRGGLGAEAPKHGSLYKP